MWQEGDLCYYDFRVHTIKQVESGRVTTVSRAIGHTGGFDLTVYPINDETTELVEWFRDRYDSLHELCPCLYFPNIIAWLNDKFDACYMCLLEQESYAPVKSQVDVGIEQIKKAYRTQVEGRNIFRIDR